MKRSNVLCADSVNFRCHGRRPAGTPYIEPTATSVASVPAPARAKSSHDSSSDSDDEEDEYAFIDVDSCSSSGVDSTYHAKVGLSFIDIDDNTTYMIDSVCREDKPHCRASFAKLFYKYHSIGTPAEYEYTPCHEVLNSSWCKWLETASASARSQRAAKRPAVVALPQQDAHSSSSVRVTRSKISNGR